MAYRRSAVSMDTVVTIAVNAAPECAADVARALDWFAEVEARCSRFDADSELRRLCARPFEPVVVSPVLFEALRVAIAVAAASGGAFDPTVGAEMEVRGYTRNYRTGVAEPWGAAASSGATPPPRPVTIGHGEPSPAAPAGTPAGSRRMVVRTPGEAPVGPDPSEDQRGWRQVILDPVRHTVRLRTPLLLDLGAVAKGLAIDLAARELTAWPGFVVEAGGDLLACGRNERGEPWRIGVRHPRRPESICTLLAVEDAAVCTSGDSARGPHLVDVRGTGRQARAPGGSPPSVRAGRLCPPRAAGRQASGPGSSTAGAWVPQATTATDRKGGGQLGGAHGEYPPLRVPAGRGQRLDGGTPGTGSAARCAAAGSVSDVHGGGEADSVASCTVIAPHAVLADALATAAAIMGPRSGLAWLDEQGVEALMITPQLRRHATPGFSRWERW